MKKILLLHGWNYRNYSSLTDETDAWHNRAEFVKILSEDYEVYKLNFPGFCCSDEPNDKSGWTLDDYALFVNDFINKNNVKPDYILGYSFGGAVAIKYVVKYDLNQKVILISPAIVRDKNNSKTYMKTPKVFDPIRNFIRDFYLINIAKNNYMVHGTKFLRNSYQNIVREELLEELIKIDPKNIKIVYGSDDKMVNPKYVLENIPQNYKKCIDIIDGGGHDIANTHAREIKKIISR